MRFQLTLIENDMSLFDDMFAAMPEFYGALADLIKEREIIDVEYEDLSDQETLEDSDSIPDVPILLGHNIKL